MTAEATGMRGPLPDRMQAALDLPNGARFGPCAPSIPSGRAPRGGVTRASPCAAAGKKVFMQCTFRSSENTQKKPSV